MPRRVEGGLPPQHIAELTKPAFIRLVQAHRRGRRLWRFKIEQVWEKAGGTVAAPHGHQAAMREVTRLGCCGIAGRRQLPDSRLVLVLTVPALPICD